MTEPAVAPVPVQQRGSRLGLIALISAIVAPIWLAGGFLLAIESSTGHLPDPLGLFVYFVITVGYFAVPALTLVAIVFGIVALATNARRGKVFGGIALGLVLLAIVGIAVYIAAAFGAFAGAIS